MHEHLQRCCIVLMEYFSPTITIQSSTTILNCLISCRPLSQQIVEIWRVIFHLIRRDHDKILRLRIATACHVTLFLLLFCRYFEWNRDYLVQFKPSDLCDVCRRMREIYYKPSQIDMHEYLGVNRYVNDFTCIIKI